MGSDQEGLTEAGDARTLALFTSAATAFARLVHDIPAPDWAGPGLGEWDLRALVGHTSRSLITVSTYLRAPCDHEDVVSAEDYYARIRDASGVHVREVNEHCEIVSLNGTVSAARCHLHIALSKEDLSTVGGHLLPGCIVNTTCELIVAPLRGWRFGTEQDAQTGYDEIVFEETNAGEEA